MIQLLCGENDFELTKKVAQLKALFKGVAERYDATNLNIEQLADIFAGQTLFSSQRLVIIDTPSLNSDVWQNLPAWAARLNNETELVLIEPKPDKRTSSYKWLKKNANVQEFLQLDERDGYTAAKWLATYASENNVTLNKQQINRLIERDGADQWALAQAVDKLSLVDEITDDWIDNVIEPNPTQNVFVLFEAALKGDKDGLLKSLNVLKETEDAYRVFGLITSQALQLALLVHGEGSATKVANDIGAKSSYPLQKMAPYASKLTKRQASSMIGLLAEGDSRLKSSDADPWLVLESTLARVASL